MKKTKRKRLEAAGWKVGTVVEFLDLTPAEESLVELRLELSRQVRERRHALETTQVELARQIGSSQSRVAKVEAGDPSVSLDLLFRALFALGADFPSLGKLIGRIRISGKRR